MPIVGLDLFDELRCKPFFFARSVVKPTFTHHHFFLTHASKKLYCRIELVYLERCIIKKE